MKVVDGSFGDDALIPMGQALKELVSEDFIADIVGGDFVLIINSPETGYFTVSNYDGGPEMLYLLEKSKFNMMYEEMEDLDDGSSTSA